MAEYLLQFFITACIAVIAYFLRDFKNRQEESNEHLQKQISEMKEDLGAYKLKAADRFVLKDDFVRATALTDRKLDKIYDEIMKLSKMKTGG